MFEFKTLLNINYKNNVCEILSYNTIFVLNLLNLHNFLFYFCLSINCYSGPCKDYNYRMR